MKKKRFQTGGNTNTVPASRQNIEQRTPAGVRPVASPVVPVGNVQGAMKNGGELKSMKKPKKMAFGGPAGPAAPLGKKPGGNVTTMPPAPRPPGMGGGFSTNPNNPTVLNHFDSRQIPPPGAGGMPIGGGSPGGIGTMPVEPVLYNRGLGPQIPFDLAAMQALRSGISNLPPGAPTRMAGGMFKKGGKVSASSYNDMTGGAAGGIGRLEKTSIAAKTKSQKLRKGGKVKGYADGGELSLGDRLALERAGFDPETRRMKRSDNSLYGAKPVEARELSAPKKRASASASASASAPAPRPRPKASPAASVRMDRAQTRNEVDRINAGIRSQSTGSIARMIELAKARDDQPEVSRLTKMNPEAAAMARPRAAAPTPAPVPRPRPKAADQPSANAARVGQGRAEQAAATNRVNDGIRSQQSSAIDRMLNLAVENKNQKEIDRLTALKAAKGMKKGGRVEAFEGSAKDMAQDKKLAKKRGMSMKDWEKSSADEKHDTQRNMKGLKKGGKAEMHAKGCKCMACGGVAKYAAGGLSTAQDGMKPALRPKPSGIAKMAKGGVVGKTFAKPLPGTKTKSFNIMPQVASGTSTKPAGSKGGLRAKASGAKGYSALKPLGQVKKMASGGKVRGTGIAQRGTKFIGEV